MGMSNNFLSQEEINALLAGEALETNESNSGNAEEILTATDKDLLGEIGNISMGSASTALYQLINQKVNITTPVVTITTLKEIKSGFETPNIVLDIEYISGIIGRNILLIKIDDGAVISNFMMGGDGKIKESHELSELEISAVSEAMNQMIGSAATSMATMFGRKVDISPPTAKLLQDSNDIISATISEDEPIVRISFKMTIGDIVDSNIMQVFPISTARNIVSIMTGQDKVEEELPKFNKEMQVSETYSEPIASKEVIREQPVQSAPRMQEQQNYTTQAQQQKNYEQPVEVHQATFEPLVPQESVPPIKNIDLILDVPLDISVVLGRTKKSIQDILSLGTGSLIELDKLAEEPVEILVNGKQIALGEVVVVDENFGVRITNIVSNVERIKTLK